MDSGSPHWLKLLVWETSANSVPTRSCVQAYLNFPVYKCRQVSALSNGLQFSNVVEFRFDSCSFWSGSRLKTLQLNVLRKYPKVLDKHSFQCWSICSPVWQKGMHRPVSLRELGWDDIAVLSPEYDGIQRERYRYISIPRYRIFFY